MAKGIRVVTEMAEKDVTFLTDVEPYFVSLVKHAANQMPFRVIKEDAEKGGPGSGNFGHAGVPGQQGGSAPGSGGGGGKVDQKVQNEWDFQKQSNADFKAAVSGETLIGGHIYKDYNNDRCIEFNTKSGKVINVNTKTKEVDVDTAKEDMMWENLSEAEKGGPGSGNFGHGGRPGEVGGSSSEGGSGGDDKNVKMPKRLKDEPWRIGDPQIRVGPSIEEGEFEWSVDSHVDIKGLDRDEVGELRYYYYPQGGGSTIRDSSTGEEYLEVTLDSGIERTRDEAKGAAVKSREAILKKKGKKKEVGEKGVSSLEKHLKQWDKELSSKKEGGDTVGMIIQSILMPRGMSLDMLLAEKSLSWLSEADLDKKQEFEKYMAFPQLSVEKFDRSSLALTKVHDKGVWVVSGKLLDQKDAEKALSLPASPMQAVVAEVPMPSTSVTFGELFDRELRSFIDIVSGAMQQTASDAKARKSAIMGALDSFGSFLSMSLDAVGKEAVEVKTALKSIQTEEGGLGAMFKTIEEFGKAVTDIVTGILNQKAAAEDEKKKKDMEEEEEKKKKAASAAPAGTVVTAESLAALEKNFKESVEVLAKSVKELTEKTDKLGAQTVTDPAAAAVDDGKTKVADPNAKKSVFGGLFVKQPKA